METGYFYMSNSEYDLVTKKTPIPTVNLIFFRKNKGNWETLLLRRKTGYAKGRWCVIGGRVRIKESLKAAIARHAKDLAVKVEILSPFESTYPAFIDDRNTQDKTKHPISLVFPVKIISGEVRNEGEEYKGYHWFSISELPKIAYGQKLQIEKTIERLKL